MSKAIRVAAFAAMFGLVSQKLSAQQLDPAAWGSDHVGRPVPEFTSGDECLFCHRDIGPTWSADRHGQTIRKVTAEDPGRAALTGLPPLKGLAGEVELLLGGSNRQRFLRRSMEHGKLDLLSAAWIPAKAGSPGRILHEEQPQWDSRTFGSSCAGCHATGVDSSKETFAALSLDCSACHGEVPEKHTTQGSLVLLSLHRRDTPQVITSICSQCHLRTGKSYASGLPFANNFVAGDNLFRDFRVDLSLAAIQRLNPGDRHVQENVRDVVMLGKESVTCLSCHDIHKQSSRKHHLVASGNICLNCHGAGSKKERVPYEVHSTVCGY